MKTKILLFLLSYFTLNECVAQHLEFKSLKVIPSGYAVFTSESLYNLTWDDTKNRYSTGSFSGTFDFDLSLNENILESYGEADLFVKKEDSLGNLLWVRQIGADL